MFVDHLKKMATGILDSSRQERTTSGPLLPARNIPKKYPKKIDRTAEIRSR
jgi:hypothetical protein